VARRVCYYLAGSQIWRLGGLAVSPDGKILSMVSDAGSWIRMHARYDGAGNLCFLDDASIGGLRSPNGSISLDSKDRDT
jgi:hypothetical protein